MGRLGADAVALTLKMTSLINTLEAHTRLLITDIRVRLGDRRLLLPDVTFTLVAP
jgi:hypothetical protein